MLYFLIKKHFIELSTIREFILILTQIILFMNNTGRKNEFQFI